MKIIFINFAPLSSNAGHLARFTLELEQLSLQHEIHIINLGSTGDNENKFKNVVTVHWPVVFDGWFVKDVELITQKIYDYAIAIHADIVLLQMEVWDLMKSLTKRFKMNVPFATIVHAMPFLGSPLQPSGNFIEDVEVYVESGISGYRKEHILKNYKFANDYSKDMILIANNNTVYKYLTTYFPNAKIYYLKSALISEQHELLRPKDFLYDFFYMARFEKGKGLECMIPMLKKIIPKFNRKLKIAIAGKVEDHYSKNQLEEVLNFSKKEPMVEIEYLGWLNQEEKKQVFSVSKIFVYLSFYDNYPTVISEALAWGLPVIVWDAPFYRYNYLNINAVQAAEYLDYESFGKVMIDVDMDYEKYLQFTKEYVDSCMDAEETASSDISVYHKIINET